MRVLPATLTLALLLSACGADDPEKLVQSAKDYMAKSDNAAAIIQLKNALQSKPDAAEARFLLGKAFLAKGDVVGAQAELKKAKDGGYPADQVVPLLARAMMGQGQFKQVTDEFGKTQLTAPEAQADMMTVLAGAWMAQGQGELAKASLDEALKRKPDHAPAQVEQARLMAAARDYSGAVKLLDQVLVTSPQSEMALKLRGDVLMYGLHQPAEALAAYKQSVQVKPDFKDGQASVVRVLFSQGQLDEAAKQVEVLQKMAPGQGQTLYLQGQLAFQKKDFKAAQEIATQLLRLTPDNPRALELAGIVEFQFNAYGQAEPLLLKAVKAAPELRVARRALILTYLRTGQVEKAVSALPADLAQSGSDPAMLAVAGQVYMVQGNQELAQRYLSKASQLDPGDPFKRTSLATSKFMTGETAVALDELHDIAASDKGVVADMALINALVKQREYDKALQAIAKLETKRANDPIPLHLRAQVLALKGDTAGARKTLERALEISPDFFPAAGALAALDLAQKKPQDAQKRFEAMLKRKPDNVQVIMALAELKGVTGGSKEDVGAILRKGVELGPNEAGPRLALIAHHLRHKEPKLALTVAQSAVVVFPKSPEMLDALGQAQLASQEFNQALNTYAKMAALVPQSTVPHMRMAGVHVANKDTANAAQSLRKALEMQPSLLTAQRGLAGLALQDKRVPDALTVARDIQKQRPQEAVGYVLEGDIQTSAKNWSAATEAYGKALKASPNATDLAVKLHSIKLMAQKKSEADKFAADWMRSHPKDAGFTFYLGDRATAAGDFSLAAVYYQKTLASQPNNPAVLNNLAWVSGKLGRKEALSFAEKANALAPDNAALMDTWATLLAGNKELPRAIEMQKKVVQLRPEAPLFKLNLAQMQVQAGDKAEAKANLLALKKLGNQFNDQAAVDKMLQSL